MTLPYSNAKFGRDTYKRLMSILYLRLAFLLVRVLPFTLYLRIIVNSVVVQGNSSAKQSILCLPKPLFDKDFEQLSYRLRGYGWIWFMKDLFTVCHDGLVPRGSRRQKAYVQDVFRNGAAWDKVVGKARVLMSTLREEKGVCCIMTANIDYWQDHALKVACRDLGLPVVVLQKEYPITEPVAAKFAKQYKGWNPHADLIAVAGKRALDSLVEAGIGSFCKVVVTGFPRLDRYRSVDVSSDRRASRRTTLLSFREGYGRNSEIEFFHFLDFLLGIVHGDAEIIVKAKSGKDASVISAGLRRLLSPPAKVALVVSSHMPLYDAFSTSRVIVGLNSLSIVEALLSHAQILIPAYIFSDAPILSESQCLEAGVHFARSEEEFREKYLDALEGYAAPISSSLLSNRKKVFSEYWRWDDSYSACELFRIALEELLQERS